MATNYPDSPDIFLEPTLPDETPLSASGPGGTRNHTEHHRDLGDAIEAIEVTASVKTHDHSGTDSIFHGPKLSQANTHQDPDTDSSAAALHHTLGVEAGQAAAGNHGYLASSSFQPGHHYIICTSSTHEISYEGLLAFETDTRRLMLFANGIWNVIWSGPAAAPPPPPPVYIPPEEPTPPPVIPDPPPPPIPSPRSRPSCAIVGVRHAFSGEYTQESPVDNQPFNLFGAEFKTDPYPTYAAMRATQPICRRDTVNGKAIWFITRYQDVAAKVPRARRRARRGATSRRSRRRRPRCRAPAPTARRVRRPAGSGTCARRPAA